ncbi:MAG: hypothetical protein WC547_11470 [Candidatus Omnitrophota bacterium]
MKKLLLSILAFSMMISMTACGAAEATLVDVTTTDGVVLKLPSDITAQGATYTNSETGDNLVVAVDVADPAAPLSKWAQADFVSSQLSDRTDLKVISYDNNKQINGKPALVCNFTFTTAKGNPVTDTLVMIDVGTKEYIINFAYNSKNSDGSLAKNLDACVASITVPAA